MLTYKTFIVTLYLLTTGFCHCSWKRDYLIKQMERNLHELQITKCPGTSPSIPGETYVRWGRSECPGDATLVYDGYAAGNSHNGGGSGSNFLCLPKIPEWKEYTNGMGEATGRIFGVEYEIDQHKPYAKSFHDKDMPCVVCLTTGRSTVLMVPGKVTCHNGWNKEFSGYLMSEQITKSRNPSEYICVDEKLEGVPGGDSSSNQAVVYPVEPVCGSLKCPPYDGGRELTCVVCSK